MDIIDAYMASLPQKWIGLPSISSKWRLPWNPDTPWYYLVTWIEGPKTTQGKRNSCFCCLFRITRPETRSIFPKGEDGRIFSMVPKTQPRLHSNDVVTATIQECGLIKTSGASGACVAWAPPCMDEWCNKQGSRRTYLCWQKMGKILTLVKMAVNGEQIQETHILSRILSPYLKRWPDKYRGIAYWR